MTSRFSSIHNASMISGNHNQLAESAKGMPLDVVQEEVISLFQPDDDSEIAQVEVARNILVDEISPIKDEQ